MNIFAFKVMIMSVLILVMLSLLKTFLKYCFKIGFKESVLFFQKTLSGWKLHMVMIAFWKLSWGVMMNYFYGR